MGFTVRKGSEKGVSGRCLENLLGEYAPLGMLPIKMAFMDVLVLAALMGQA